MKRRKMGIRGTGLAATLLLLATAAPTVAQDGPHYDGPETETLVEALIEAHGGWAPWQAAEAVEYTHIMYTPTMMAGGTPWWISHEIVQQGTRKVHHEWPIDGAALAHDGEAGWSVRWAKPNRPDQMARVHYYFLFLPWLSQDAEVSLARTKNETLPDDDRESLVVTMESTARGQPPFRLFIDPETHVLRGFAMGQALHTIRKYSEADGLLLPADWTTQVNGEVIGHHAAIGVSLDAEWSPSLLEAPEGATVTTGS